MGLFWEGAFGATLLSSFTFYPSEHLPIHSIIGMEGWNICILSTTFKKTHK